MKTQINSSFIIIELLIFILTVFLSACDRSEALDPVVNVSVSTMTIKAGEEFTLTISHNTNALCVYTGDSTHNYLRSAAYLLLGKTDQNLQDSLLRPMNTDISTKLFDFTTMPLTSTTLLNDDAKVTNIVKNINLFPLATDADLTEDSGKVVLRLQATPNNWARALRVYPNFKLGQNKTCVTRLRFLNTNQVTKVGASWIPLVTAKPVPMKIITRISGIAVGETTPSDFLVNTLSDYFVMTPDTAYQNRTFDLTDFITAWEASTLKKMSILHGIQFFYSGSGTAAYDGKVLIQSITVGGQSISPFDLGVNLPVLDNTGVSTYKYTYSKPGNYNITVLGTNYSNKIYSGNGYQTNRGNINGNEYNSITKTVVVPITIVP